jgi:hypothetical protein
VVADIRTTGAYLATLRQLGVPDVRRRRLGWRFWWGNPLAATSLAVAPPSVAEAMDVQCVGRLRCAERHRSPDKALVANEATAREGVAVAYAC